MQRETDCIYEWISWNRILVKIMDIYLFILNLNLFITGEFV